MAGQLVYTVAVTDDEGSTHWFGPGDEVPAWAIGQISNPDAWDEPPADASGDDPDAPVAYGKRSVDELKGEIERRNADRDDEDDHVVVEGTGKKADLVAALEADDAAQADPDNPGA